MALLVVELIVLCIMSARIGHGLGAVASHAYTSREALGQMEMRLAWS